MTGRRSLHAWLQSTGTSIRANKRYSRRSSGSGVVCHCLPIQVHHHPRMIPLTPLLLRFSVARRSQTHPHNLLPLMNHFILTASVTILIASRIRPVLTISQSIAQQTQVRHNRLTSGQAQEAEIWPVQIVQLLRETRRSVEGCIKRKGRIDYERDGRVCRYDRERELEAIRAFMRCGRGSCVRWQSRKRPSRPRRTLPGLPRSVVIGKQGCMVTITRAHQASQMYRAWRTGQGVHGEQARTK